jgi:Zn-dependent M16 (insulinase) family peptidase
MDKIGYAPVLGKRRLTLLLAAITLFLPVSVKASQPTDLHGLRKGQALLDFEVANLYSGAEGDIVGAKFWHIPSGSPVFVFQRETVPEAFMWVDTPAETNQGLAHALEHLLVGKGTTGRYSSLLKEMRLSTSCAATYRDFNYYCFSSGAGLEGFFEQLHAWLEALYKPDFTNAEAELEFYHFGVTADPATKRKLLIEKGTVYDEMASRQGIYSYYYVSNQKAFGELNPLGLDGGGVPDEMRGVPPEDIRKFHERHYRLGPTTGFIFLVSPKENLADFLSKVSTELRTYSRPSRGITGHPAPIPKYPIASPGQIQPTISRFPGADETSPGEILLAWPPVENTSIVDLKLLQLFLHGLASGEQSSLYKTLVDSKSRQGDFGATAVWSTAFLANSPEFGVPQMWISGIAGNRISVALIDQLRGIVLKKMQEVSAYPDRSASLLAFNKMMARVVQTEHRSELVWTKSPPLFGASESPSDWKEYLEYLEMDPAFTRSLSQEPVWRLIGARLNSRKNIWRDLIKRFHLLEVPTATASAPSAELAVEIENAKKERIEQKIKSLERRYATGDAQEALSRFEQDERTKTREVDLVAAKVSHPRFTDHPPLTPDDEIRYRQFELGGVPVVASLFDDPPTIDIGLSFDLDKIPRKYYRFLPLLPRCLDSLGLKGEGQDLAYADLLAEVQARAYRFSVDYPYNIRSNRSELRIRASAADEANLREVLLLIRRMMRFSFLELSNIDRLRDIVEKSISEDDVYTRQAESNWLTEPAFAFKNLDRPLFLAVDSHFTQAHWNARLKWLLHQPASPEAIDDLARFANQLLAAPAGLSKAEFSEALNQVKATGLEAELVEYWRKNLSSFPESGLAQGLQQLALEVQQDLRTGPASTVADLRELQRIVLNRNALRINLTASERTLHRLRPSLIRFVKSIPPAGISQTQRAGAPGLPPDSAAWRPEKRDAPRLPGFPVYVGFVVPDASHGNAVFLSDFPGYSQLDHDSLVQVLSSNLLTGSGPQTLYMKTWEAGLAYSNGVRSDPDSRLLQYYAERSPDLPTLVEFVNAIARKIDGLEEDSLVDYTLSRTFSFSRKTLPISERGRLLANDIRDGIEPEKVRRFSEAILSMRQEPDLAKQLKQAGLASICGVLLLEDCRQQQARSRSTFFLVGSEKVLTEAEQRLSISGLRRLYPSDYWIQ